MLDQADRFEVGLAWADDEPVAGHVASHLGDTCVYLLGATTEMGRKLKAAYRLQWSVIERAVERGEKNYDLGGIDVEGNPGVYRFKRGLGGAEMEGAGPCEYRPRAFNQLTTAGAEKAHRALRGLSATHAGIVQLAVPVLAAIGGVVLLAESFGLRLGLATLLILGGILLAIVQRRASA